MSEELKPTKAHFHDPYVIQLIRMLDQHQERIEELQAELIQVRGLSAFRKDENERLREALDKCCETVETRPQVGCSIDYANGFSRGVQCQRLRAKCARDGALAATLEDNDGTT